MSLVAIVNLAERLLNQGSAQGRDTPSTQKTNTSQAADNAQVTPLDLFTPSGQTGAAPTAAQEAGLFSAAQFSFFSAAADFLLGQTTPGAASSDTAAPLKAVDGNPGVATGTVAATQVSGRNGNVGATAAAGAPLATTGATAGANANTAASSTAAQQHLQALNLALRALGLGAQDIQVIDRIAAIVNDYNPGAFTAMTFQLEQLAQQLAQPGGAPAAAAPPATAANVAAQGGGNGTDQMGPNGENFQLKELVIKFTGSQAEASLPTGGAPAAAQFVAPNGAGNFGVAAFDVQIEEVNLTLRNGGGGSTQIKTPAATTNQTSGARARVARA